MANCPKCNREFSNPGLHGHLRFSHGLDGEELEQAYSEAIQQAESKAESYPSKQSRRPNGSSKEAEGSQESGEGARPASGPDTTRGGDDRPDERDRPNNDPLHSRLEDLRKARERRRTVEEVMETAGGSSSFFPSRSKNRPANRTWEELLEECAEKEKRYEEALRRQVRHHEVDRS